MRNSNKSKTPLNVKRESGPLFTEIPIQFKLVVFNKEVLYPII